MDHIEEIVREIEKRMPGVRTRIERGENSRGPVWIDVTNGKYGVAIEWRQGMGFGLTSLPSDNLGEASDETYDSASELSERVEELLSTGQRTSPPKEALLKTLREHRRVSQDTLAQLMGVSQPNISRLERRIDMSIRTLRAVIEAIGGRLEIVARFGDDAVRITQFDEPEARAGSRKRR
ncbi:MAG TPA: XRE family transcriptional regulator [Kofleriaceae bacterium]|nr:XRE family transcriptional regulator [Kofleriaceae bacterium]